MGNTEPSNFFPPMKSNLLTDRSVFSVPTRRIPKLLHAGPEKQTHPKSHPAQSLPLPVQTAHSKLNPEQQKAVCAVEPAVAVIAGPGTGKTKTLVSRAVHLLCEKQVSPRQLTAVTFTIKQPVKCANGSPLSWTKTAQSAT